MTLRLLLLLLFVCGCRESEEKIKPIAQVIYETTKGFIAIEYEVNEKIFQELKLKVQELDWKKDLYYTDEEQKTIDRLKYCNSLNKHPRGSGFVSSEDGEIISSAHVLKVIPDIPGKFYAIFYDGARYPIKDIQRNEERDIAIGFLDAPGVKLNVLEMELERQVYRGEQVISFGNAPLVWFGFVEGRVIWTSMEISGNDIDGIGTDKTMDVIQMNMKITGGFSGGPVVNIYGRVIGINFASSYKNPSSFAIPILDKFVFEDLDETIDAGGIK